MELYTSSNGWTAWTTFDPVATNSVSSRDNKFVIVGFLPSNQFCIAPDSYECVEQAQVVISAFDNQTITFELGDQLIKVFTCFDGSYWWQRSCINGEKYPPERIYTAQNTTEAVAIVGSQLACSIAQRRLSRRKSTCFIMG
ncbi:hypothetical protein NIES2101_40885 [Calothrix sp. HK-06]|nr:hypothetical protein NIES2101_40885 [Calothrix sp. HK-06]